MEMVETAVMPGNQTNPWDAGKSNLCKQSGTLQTRREKLLALAMDVTILGNETIFYP